MKQKLLLLIFAVFLATSCEKLDIPQSKLVPGKWSDNGLTLKTSNGVLTNDTLYVYKDITTVYYVVDGNGNIVASVVYNFGDGSQQITGSQVSHIYNTLGVYDLSAVVNGTNLGGKVKVIPYGTGVSDEVVHPLYHSYYNNISHDTIGLNVEYISGYQSPGTYFESGDNNNWGKTWLYNTRVINGHTYAIFYVERSLGLMTMNFGKTFTGGGDQWNYSPNSAYWHPNSPGSSDGKLWLYFTSTGVSPNPGGNTGTQPGLWGDEGANWYYRGEITSLSSGNTSATVKLYANRYYFQNPFNPQLMYSYNGGTSWSQTSWAGETDDYYSAVLYNVAQNTVISFYSLARQNEPSSKVVGGSMYYQPQDLCMVDISEHF